MTRHWTVVLLGVSGCSTFTIPRYGLSAENITAMRNTRIGWRMLFESAAERDRIARFAVDANEQNLDRLEAELARTA